jgi:hypothetical protein
MAGGDFWYEIITATEGIVTSCVFVYWAFFYKDKCPRCIARDELEKVKKW